MTRRFCWCLECQISRRSNWRKFKGFLKKLTRNLLRSYQETVKKLSRNCQKNSQETVKKLKKLSRSLLRKCQKTVKKLSRNCQEIEKFVKKLSRKIVKKFQIVWTSNCAWNSLPTAAAAATSRRSLWKLSKEKVKSITRFLLQLQVLFSLPCFYCTFSASLESFGEQVF